MVTNSAPVQATSNGKKKWAKILLVYLGIAELSAYIVIFYNILATFTLMGVFACDACHDPKQFGRTIFFVSFAFSLLALFILGGVLIKRINRYKRGDYSVTWRWIVLYLLLGLSFFFVADAINEILYFISTLG